MKALLFSLIFLSFNLWAQDFTCELENDCEKSEIKVKRLISEFEELGLLVDEVVLTKEEEGVYITRPRGLSSNHRYYVFKIDGTQESEKLLDLLQSKENTILEIKKIFQSSEYKNLGIKNIFPELGLYGTPKLSDYALALSKLMDSKISLKGKNIVAICTRSVDTPDIIHGTLLPKKPLSEDFGLNKDSIKVSYTHKELLDLEEKWKRRDEGLKKVYRDLKFFKKRDLPLVEMMILLKRVDLELNEKQYDHIQSSLESLKLPLFSYDHIKEIIDQITKNEQSDTLSFLVGDYLCINKNDSSQKMKEKIEEMLRRRK